MKYFAYGSNMSSGRMIERGVNFTSKEKGILKGYRFIINKKSAKDMRVGFANVIEDKNSQVEGILYEITDNEIYKLDKYEGYPKHYHRELIEINGEYATVYIANEPWISKNELYTTEEYKNHILEGKEFLSEDYYNKLLEIKVL